MTEPGSPKRKIPAVPDSERDRIGKRADAELTPQGEQNAGNPFEGFSVGWRVGEVETTLKELDESFYQDAERLVMLIQDKIPPEALDQPQRTFVQEDWPLLNEQYNRDSERLEKFLHSKSREGGLTQEDADIIQQHVDLLLKCRDKLRVGVRDLQNFLEKTGTDERLLGEIVAQLKKKRILNPARYRKLGAPHPEKGKGIIRDAIARALAERPDYHTILEDNTALLELAGEVIRKMHAPEQTAGDVSQKTESGVAGNAVHHRGAVGAGAESSEPKTAAASVLQTRELATSPENPQLAPEAQVVLQLVKRWDELAEQVGAEKLARALSKEEAAKESVSVHAIPAIRERLMTLGAEKKLGRADRLWVENITNGMQALAAFGERLQKSEDRKQREEGQNKEWAARIPDDERALEKVIIIRKLMRGFIRKSGEKFIDMELNRATALDCLTQGVMEIIDAALEKMTTLESHQRAALAREIVNSISIRW